MDESERIPAQAPESKAPVTRTMFSKNDPRVKQNSKLFFNFNIILPDNFQFNDFAKELEANPDIPVTDGSNVRPRTGRPPPPKPVIPKPAEPPMPPQAARPPLPPQNAMNKPKTQQQRYQEEYPEFDPEVKQDLRRDSGYRPSQDTESVDEWGYDNDNSENSGYVAAW